MESILLIVHVLLALAVVGLVLLQQGKGADAGASFGGGASQTVFGSQGSGNFLTRSTAILATLFFVTSFGLAILAKQKATAEVDIGLPDPMVVEQQSVEPEPIQETIEDELPTLDEPMPAPAADSDLPQIDE